VHVTLVRHAWVSRSIVPLGRCNIHKIYWIFIAQLSIAGCHTEPGCLSFYVSRRRRPPPFSRSRLAQTSFSDLSLSPFIRIPQPALPDLIAPPCRRSLLRAPRSCRSGRRGDPWPESSPPPWRGCFAGCLSSSDLSGPRIRRRGGTFVGSPRHG
jgi:hypothetical protein